MSEQTLPKGWSEASPGGMATNSDPTVGGIIDCRIVDGAWFVVFNRDGLAPLEGLPSRQAAFESFHKTLQGGELSVAQDNEIPECKQHSDATLQKYMLVAADSVSSLRKVDVHRVLESVSGNIDDVTRGDVASFIVSHRPELALEVAEVMKEDFPEEQWNCHPEPEYGSSGPGM